MRLKSKKFSVCRFRQKCFLVRPANFLTIAFAIWLSFLFFIENSRAAVINADSCNATDIQSAIDLSKDGDTILVPAGTCFWISDGTKKPSVVLKGKSLFLKGQGVDQTIINYTGGTSYNFGENPLSIENSVAPKSFRISGFTFYSETRSVYPAISVSGKWIDWRIDHIKFKITNGRAIMASSGYSDIYGVIDHNTFLPLPSFSQQILIQNYAGSPPGNTAWQAPTKLGSKEILYVEDNYFEYASSSQSLSPIIDSDYGGSFVVRYNTIINSHVHAHGGYEYTAYPGTDRRGTRQFEIYNNVFAATGPVGGTTAAQIRGGAGVIFNNTVTGNYGQWSGTNSTFGFYAYAGANGLCNGTRPYDENLSGQNGRHCRDVSGVGQDLEPFPGKQSHEPVYAWNNTQNGAAATVGTNAPTHILIGTDILNNVQKPGYTPYAYPHPLITDCSNYPLTCDQNDNDITAPSAPTNLRVF